MTKDSDRPAGFASLPCFAHELELSDNGYVVVDPVETADVARWRKTERERLITGRLAVSAEERQRVADEVAGELDSLIEPRPGITVSLYWPFRGELDLRGWMRTTHDRGIRIALPLVAAKGQPLTFREWTPDGRMERGVWNILVPADGAPLTPDVTIAPLVGFDPGCYRLGYGGGFFDRTLAALSPRPMVIGAGHPSTAIRTIYPQSHDIPMDVIVTGAGRVIRR
jgi:5-formyltetrahydrofolate cyclo-ligase